MLSGGLIRIRRARFCYRCGLYWKPLDQLDQVLKQYHFSFHRWNLHTLFEFESLIFNDN